MVIECFHVSRIITKIGTFMNDINDRKLKLWGIWDGNKFRSEKRHLQYCYCGLINGTMPLAIIFSWHTTLNTILIILLIAHETKTQFKEIYKDINLVFSKIHRDECTYFSKIHRDECTYFGIEAHYLGTFQ